MFEKYIERYFAEIDILMRQIIATLADTTPGFDVMLRYPLGWVDQDNQPYNKVTGKRIRPLLLLLVNEAAGGNWQSAVPAAAAVEILHNFSLVHDDIQDNSPIRHNRPSVWKIWGEAHAINVGDALFGLAFKALDTLRLNGTPAETTLEVWSVFNDTVLELTRGQHLDLRFEHDKVVTVDEYISMIRGKSAALVAACAHIGALIATDNTQSAQHYADFGINMGIAFQIRDDILGIWGDTTLTGKSTATDIISRKKSLPVLYGLDYSEQLRTIYAKPLFTDEDVQQAVKLLEEVNAQTFVQEQEAYYYQRAVEALEKAAPTGEAADELKEFIGILFQRSY